MRLRIAGQRGNDSPDELRAFAIGEIEPPTCRGGHDQFGPHQSRVERHDGDAVGRKLVSHIRRHLVRGGFRDSVDRVADVLLRRPEADVHDQPALSRKHDPGSVGGGHECGAHARVHHAGPSMRGLFPEGQRPSELAILAHLLVATPSGVDQHVQSLGNLRECRRSLIVPQMIARHARDGVGEIRRRDGAARREDSESALRESDGGSPAHAAARSGDECNRHASV